MADLEREHDLGFTDVRRTQAGTSTPLSSQANLIDVPALRTRLAAISGSYYTAARLNNMTKNDMVYAVRLNDESTGVK